MGLKSRHKKKSISVLIPDGESHLLIYVVNCLSQIKDVEINIMSNEKHIAHRYSRLISHFSYYPKTLNEVHWIDNINEEMQKLDIDVILPIYEKGIGILIRNKEKLLFKEKLCLLPNYENFKKAKHKWSLAEHLSKTELPFPKSYRYRSKDFEDSKSLKYPLIVKPTEGIGGGTGVQLFNNQEALHDFFSGEDIDENLFLIQEYIKGYDLGCGVLCKNGTILAFTIQKSTMNADNPFAPLLGVEFVHEKKLYKSIEKLMKSLDWSGVAQVDIRYDETSKIFKIIEVNARFWGSLEASQEAGINFPYLLCLATLKNSFEQPVYKHASYLNLKGLSKSIRNDFLFLFKFKYILRHTSFKYALKDPLPIVYKYVTRTRNILLKRLRLQ